jgi:hypothetical protein
LPVSCFAAVGELLLADCDSHCQPPRPAAAVTRVYPDIQAQLLVWAVLTEMENGPCATQSASNSTERKQLFRSQEDPSDHRDTTISSNSPVDLWMTIMPRRKTKLSNCGTNLSLSLSLSEDRDAAHPLKETKIEKSSFAYGPTIDRATHSTVVVVSQCNARRW